MKRSIASTLILALGLGFAVQANAYSDHDRIERRQHRQEIRIERGIEKRDLTRKEVRRLKREQREISQLKRLLEDAAKLLYLTLEKNKFVISDLRNKEFSELRLRGHEKPVGKTITNLIAIIITSRRFIAYSALTSGWHVLSRRPWEEVSSVDAEDFSAFVVTSDRLLSFDGTSGSWLERRRE